MRLANRDETIAELQGQISEIRVSMSFGEGRLAELYAEQERWEGERARLEEELAKKNNVIDKLRAQLREIEKETRDSTRRLAEQAAQFEAERQAFYDNTAHLKSRIQSLTDAQKDWKASQRDASPEAEPNPTEVHEQESKKASPRKSLSREEPDEPPEMAALRLELSTLETSHGSLGQTVKALQSQLVEVQRVNAELQEENEAYTTLLREKTLSGQIDIMRHGPDDHEDDMESASGVGLDSELAESERYTESERHASMSPVETRRIVSHTHSLRRAVSPARSGRSGRSTRRVAAETLADLPVAGPGLDLAAELGRAENWEGVDADAEAKQNQEEEKPKEEEVKVSNAELEALRAEVKHLKDANKALSLYASKIIDRIISQEGFEHVLAADYTAPPPKPAPAPKKEEPKPRPLSILARATSLSRGPAAPPSPVTRPSPLTISTEPTRPVADKAEPSTPMDKRERRGLSMDWSRFNPFSRGNQESAQPPVNPKLAGLKPLNLRADPSLGSNSALASPIVHGNRKLDNEEDEEDRVERERLNAHMKLLGVEKGQDARTPGAAVSTFAAAGGISRGSSSGADTPSSRLSVGWGRRPSSVRQDSAGSGVRIPSEDLRAEHLELEDEAQVTAVAETRIAALDKREKALSAELAKGRGGGFTEPPERGGRVRRRSNASATSTLFSAGRMSRGGSEADIGEDAEENVN